MGHRKEQLESDGIFYCDDTQIKSEIFLASSLLELSIPARKRMLIHTSQLKDIYEVLFLDDQLYWAVTFKIIDIYVHVYVYVC